MSITTDTTHSQQSFRPSIQPYQPGDLAAKHLIEHYAPMLERQGAAKAKMWLSGWEARLERVRALDVVFDDKLAAILDQPLPPAKPFEKIIWLETQRRDDRPRPLFNRDVKHKAASKRGAIPVPATR